MPSGVKSVAAVSTGSVRPEDQAHAARRNSDFTPASVNPAPKRNAHPMRGRSRAKPSDNAVGRSRAEAFLDFSRVARRRQDWSARHVGRASGDDGAGAAFSIKARAVEARNAIPGHPRAVLRRKRCDDAARILPSGEGKRARQRKARQDLDIRLEILRETSLGAEP